jgi:erythromycin esterase-like protein
MRRARVPLSVGARHAHRARGAVRAWFAAPHRTREIGALFTTEEHMDAVVRLSGSFDAVLFIDQTTPARRL